MCIYARAASGNPDGTYASTLLPHPHSHKPLDVAKGWIEPLTPRPENEKRPSVDAV